MEELLIFNQVRQGRISDNIVAQIKNAIFAAIYKPGDKLPSEKELIKLFNVSRISLREGLRSLEKMGLITIKPGVTGGAFVSQMGTKSVSDSLSNMVRLGRISLDEIWEFRMIIEPNIARLAAERRSDWDIKKMVEMISVRENALKARKTPVVSHIDFHLAIAKSARNPLPILIMEAIGEILIDEFKKLSFSLSDYRSIVKFHKEIFEYIKRKDTQRVGKSMHAHLMDVKKRLKI
jgi:GntR family transcriptional repressor for pyruvate dehydrogenase complex